MNTKVTLLKAGDKIKLFNQTVEVVFLHINHGYNVAVLYHKCNKGFVYGTTLSSNTVVMFDENQNG